MTAVHTIEVFFKVYHIDVTWVIEKLPVWGCLKNVQMQDV
jgi:hypothetical protein